MFAQSSNIKEFPCTIKPVLTSQSIDRVKLPLKAGGCYRSVYYEMNILRSLKVSIYLIEVTANWFDSIRICLNTG